MGILDHTGKIVVELAGLVGAPVVAAQAKMKLEKAKAAADEVASYEANGVVQFCPYGGGFAELHRNFRTWRSVPPGWKRRLLGDAAQIALSNFYITTTK